MVDDEQRFHEEATIKAFIAPLRRHRVLELLANPKRRKTITSELAHFKWLDPRFATVISGSGSASRRIFDLLKSKGAGETCWLISESPDLDGRKMSLTLALDEVIGRDMGTMLSCIPGKLAYFEDEDGRWLLER